MRLTSAGQLDGSFGSGGIFRQQLSTYSTPGSTASGVVVQPDGKVVITGYERDSAGKSVFFAERLLASNGTPDPGFGTGGVFEHQLGLGGTPSSQGDDVVVQPDGKLVFSVAVNVWTPASALTNA